MTLHYDPNNPWDWWQKALDGAFGAIHDGLPQQGFYRVRRKNEGWEPVAIWLTSDNQWAALRAGKCVRAEDIWTFACRHPVTHDAYERASRGEGWADEPPAPAAGDNSRSTSTDPFDIIRDELVAETETASGFLAKPIADQDAANQAGIWAKRVGDLAKRADGERETEKKPHLEASRAVDAKWRPVVDDAKELSAKLKRHVEPFLKEQARKTAEEARAAEEAARKLRETAAASDERPEDERAALRAKAAEMERQAQPQNARAGRTGATVALRTYRTARIVDFDACYAALKTHPDMAAFVQQLAQRAVAAKVPLAGVEAVEEQRAA